MKGLAGLVSSETCLFYFQMPFSSYVFVCDLLCVCICVQISSFDKDNSDTGQGTQMIYFNLITSLKTLSPNSGTFWGANKE